MSLPDQLGKKLEEKSYQQKPDMHPIDIRIRGDYNLIIPQVFQVLFNSQSRLNQIELFVLVHDLSSQTERIKRFALEAEDTLSLHIAGLGDRTARRISFRDEKGALETVLILGVQMNATISEFPVMNLALLGSLTGNFLNTFEFLALTLTALDLLKQSLCGLRVLWR